VLNQKHPRDGCLGAHAQSSPFSNIREYSRTLRRLYPISSGGDAGSATAEPPTAPREFPDHRDRVYKPEIFASRGSLMVEVRMVCAKPGNHAPFLRRGTVQCPGLPTTKNQMFDDFRLLQLFRSPSLSRRTLCALCPFLWKNFEYVISRRIRNSQFFCEI